MARKHVTDHDYHRNVPTFPAPDLTGQTLGRWKVIQRAGHNSKRQSLWQASCLRCECVQILTGTALRRNGGGRAMCKSGKCPGRLQFYILDNNTMRCRLCGESFPFDGKYFCPSQEAIGGLARLCKKCNHKRIKNGASKLRMRCLREYSSKEPECACCHESHLEFLTIDHIDGGGADHRRKMGSRNIYRWLMRNHFPKGFRVLCINCNFSLGKYGYCPHDPFHMRQNHT